MIILQKEESLELQKLKKYNQAYPSKPESIQIIQEILSGTEDDNNKDMLDSCRVYYANIDEFEHNYDRTKAIWWYTRDSFLYKMVNKALKSLDIDTLYEIRMFIRDLHYSIEECFQNEEPNTSLEWLYRGQHMLIVEFEKLKNNVVGLFSVYNFLSTTEYKELATIYAGQSVDDEIAVLFEIEIKSSFVADIPFADIEI